MLRPEFASVSIGDGERLAARIVAKFMFRHCLALSEIGGGDLSRGFVLTAILDANIRHLRPGSDEARQLGGIESLPGDDVRRPISVNALARTLRMPYETTRRHVTKLIEDGACIRTGRGVIVPTAWIGARNDIALRLYASLRTLLSVLHSAGFDLEAMALAPVEPSPSVLAAE